VLPPLSREDALDGHGTYAELGSDVPHHQALIATIEDAMHFEFGQAMLNILLTVEVAAFAGHILEVIGTRPKKEMLWIYTLAHITVVKDEQPIGNFPVVDHPRHLMRLRLVASSGHLDLPITATLYARRPKPTFLRPGLCNFVPEPLHKYVAHHGDGEPDFATV
tara:strand:- start:412 stop:903 length:492 start_codon:yes stop_codon:yes gene_type:complete